MRLKGAHLLCILITGLVSTFDVYMTLVYSDQILEREENPLSGFIMHTYGVDSFIVLKACTTILVVGILAILANTKYRVVIIVVTLFQVSLFVYLNLSVTDFTECLNPRNADDYFPITHLKSHLRISEKIQ